MTPTLKRPTAAAVDRALLRCEAIRAAVDAHITPERMLRYLRALCDTPAPSGAAALTRAPVLQALLADDEALGAGGVVLDPDFRNTGAVTLTTGPAALPGLWYVAHLDSISYLVHPAEGGRHPLVPYCYHLTAVGRREARALRYDLDAGAFVEVCAGTLVSENGRPSFESPPDVALRPGDRVVPVTPLAWKEDGTLTGHFDNAGGVAAMAVAAPVFAGLGIGAVFAMPDEEEGPAAAGNQSLSRGSARLLAAAPPPRLTVVIDMQQTAAEGNTGPDGAGIPGRGAVLSEFSSLARGAVTPPPLYAATSALMRGLAALGTTVRETSNIYTSRSDDVSVMLRSAEIVLLGFPGSDRHFDNALPSAHLDDLVNLSKALVFLSMLAAELDGGSA